MNEMEEMCGEMGRCAGTYVAHGKQNAIKQEHHPKKEEENAKACKAQANFYGMVNIQ